MSGRGRPPTAEPPSAAAGGGRPAPATAQAPGPALPADPRAAQWALLAGNLAIGFGVMVVPGTLADLAADLQVSVARAGQLITVGAALIAVGAPLLAAALAAIDRRRLLTAALLWYVVGHGLAALLPGYATLLPVRALAVLGAAVFTPQAAATIGLLVPPQRRGQAITFIFLGWSLASVAGMPLAQWLGAAAGWRVAFAVVAGLALLAAAAVWRAVPDGLRPAPLTAAHWRQVATSPLLLGMVAVTALSAAGQFTLFSYFAPFLRQGLGLAAGQVSLMYLWFGALGLCGNVLASRHIDRLGPGRVVALLLAAMALSQLLWPLGRTLPALALVLLPWGLGCFASNSAQQARLVAAAPALAPALIALNTSAMYLGQATGAASGGVLIATTGYGPLHQVGLAWLLAGLALSLWVSRRARRQASAVVDT